MEDFKIENFKKEHQGTPFPSFRTLSEAEKEALREAIGAAAKVPVSSDLLAFTKAVCARTKVGEFWATEESFDLRATLDALGIKPRSRLFVSWYRFDNIDEMDLEDLAKYFDDIWYQGADDLDLFDRTSDWMVSVRHDGLISCARFGSLA